MIAVSHIHISLIKLEWANMVYGVGFHLLVKKIKEME